jgi:quercetin dioxygenase-like cupin family protein
MAHSLPAKGRTSILPALYALTHYLRRPNRRARGAIVTFEPGARPAWHTHPLGQTLIVTSGRGWAQSEGGPKAEIRPVDVVWCPPNEKHWRGATTTTAMTHIAIQEALDGKVVTWMEKVSDEQYQAGLEAK